MVWIIVGSILGFLLLSYLIFIIVFNIKLVYTSTRPKWKTREESVQKYHFNEDKGYLAYKPEEFTITLKDGYIIHCDYFNNNDSKDLIILVHGHASTRHNMYKFVPLFKKLGFSIIRYDRRGHGDNERCPCLMGYKESEDLLEIVDYVRSHYPHKSISLCGTSMGGATVGMASDRLKDIRFLVLDCPYASLEILGRDFDKKVFQPSFLGYLIFKAHFRHKTGINLDDVSAIKHLRNNDIPTIHMHGSLDDFVLPHNMEILYKNNKASIKEFHYLPNGTHSDNTITDPLLYEQYMKEFLSKLEKK